MKSTIVSSVALCFLPDSQSLNFCLCILFLFWIVVVSGFYNKETLFVHIQHWPFRSNKYSNDLISENLTKKCIKPNIVKCAHCGGNSIKNTQPTGYWYWGVACFQKFNLRNCMEYYRLRTRTSFFDSVVAIESPWHREVSCNQK